MYDFRIITANELSELIHGKKQFEVVIPDSVTKFKQHIPNVDFFEPQEIPPSPVIFTAEGIARVLLYSGDGLEGKFTQFVVFVYAFGGRIHYTETTSGIYKAVVSWPDAE